MKRQSDTLQSALAYAQRFGWPVFPLSPGTKIPLKGTQGFKDATTDPDQIRQWWAQHPGANIGLRCGKLVAVDLDVKGDTNGLETWHNLKSQHGIDDGTLTSLTPSGGQHLIYAANGAAVGNSAGKLGLGVDVRGDGGYIVLPPSTLADGGEYAWDVGHHPGDHRPAPLPADLLRLLTEPDPVHRSAPRTAPASTNGTSYARAALKSELGALVQAREGTRNHQLNRSAFSLGQLVGADLLDEGKVEADLERVALAIGLGEHEARRTIGSGLKKGKESPREVPTNGGGVGSKPKPAPEASSAQTERDRSLLSFDADDEGNAQAVAYMHGRRFLFCDAYGWMHYTGTHWERENAEGELDRAVIDTLKTRRTLAVRAEKEAVVKATRPSAHNVRSVKFLLRSLIMASVRDFDSSPDHISVHNGVIDLRSGQLEPHCPERLFTYCLPVSYDPDVDAREWEVWLLETVGGDESVALYLQQSVGYSLTGHTREECLFYLHGPTRAGKGTFTETLLAMMGRDPLATEADFTTFTRKRENDMNSADLAKLRPCRLVIASESGKNQWLNAAKIKQVTGGNEIYCALKYRDHFSYRPQYAVWLVSNYAPKVDAEDDAAWARLRVIEFPNSYLGKEDKALKARMRQPAVLCQVLTWAVQGAMMWYASGARGMATPPTVEAATQKARDRIDFVGQWLDECVEKTDRGDDFVSNPTLHASYKTWCEANGATPKQIAGLTQALNTKGYDAGVQGRIAGSQSRGCRGIKLVGTVMPV